MGDRLYLAGPMTGIPEHNYPRFHQAAEHLRALGLQVMSPAELHPNPEPGRWEHYLRIDIAEMVTHCDGLVLLPGWLGSQGARLEVHIAAALGWPVHEYAELVANRTNTPNPESEAPHE